MGGEKEREDMEGKGVGSGGQGWSERGEKSIQNVTKVFPHQPARGEPVRDPPSRSWTWGVI